jgi:hypothetical protein
MLVNAKKVELLMFKFGREFSAAIGPHHKLCMKIVYVETKKN